MAIDEHLGERERLDVLRLVGARPWLVFGRSVVVSADGFMATRLLLEGVCARQGGPLPPLMGYHRKSRRLGP